MIGAGAERNGKPFLVICKVVIYLWWITKPWFDKVEHSNESFSAIILVIKSEFRAVSCFALWILVSVNMMGFSFFWVWLSPLVETWWRRDDDSGYSGKTRSIPFYIWIWTTYALWLPGLWLAIMMALFRTIWFIQNQWAICVRKYIQWESGKYHWNSAIGLY